MKTKSSHSQSTDYEYKSRWYLYSRLTIDDINEIQAQALYGIGYHFLISQVMMSCVENSKGCVHDIWDETDFTLALLHAQPQNLFLLYDFTFFIFLLL